MDRAALESLLGDVAAGRVEPAEATARLARLPYADLGMARIDHHRALRQGMPEAVYGPGKSAAQCAAIVAELLSHGEGPVILTRTDEAQRAAVLAAHPGALVTGRTLVWRPAGPERPHRAGDTGPERPHRAGDTGPERPHRAGDTGPREVCVHVVTAGTADLTVAEECVAVLAAFGVEAKLLADCGVAGIHRLLDHVDSLDAADAVVVVAGMEGALPSVVAGLVACPVVAVPTSVGYGSALDGITALLAMTSSCAPGVTVVGIDNGYGAACAVARAVHPR